jgi:hypothetical protein
MGRTACTEPQCLYKGALYLYLTLWIRGWMGFSGPQSVDREPPVGSGSNIVILLTEPSGVTQLDVAAYRTMNNRIGYLRKETTHLWFPIERNKDS